MKLSLIGMSGAGKSYWSKRLAEEGFTRFGCDEVIDRQLLQYLTRPDGSRMRMGEWMGFPYESQYSECEKVYLGLEEEVVSAALDYCEKAPAAEKVVIDTTGSVIYLTSSTQERLSRLTRVVYLHTPEEVRHQMAERYIEHPLAVLWNGEYVPAEGETERESLARCYKNLIAVRQEGYSSLSGVTLAYTEYRHPDFSVRDLLSRVGLEV